MNAQVVKSDRRRRALATKVGLTPVLVTIVLVTMVATPLHSQPSQTSSSPELSGERITVRESVKRTLDNSYVVQQARESVETRRGVLQEAGGQFNPLLFIDSSYNYERRVMLPPELAIEVRRRVPLEFLAVEGLEKGSPGFLDQAANELDAGAPSRETQLFVRCGPLSPSEFGFAAPTRVVVELLDGRELILCLSFDGRLVGIEDPTDIGIPDNVGTWALLRALNDLGLLSDEIAKDIERRVSEFLRGTADQLRDVAAVLRIQRARLGGLPEEQEFVDLDFELGEQFRYRNGMALTASLFLRATEDNYAGKPPGQPKYGDSLFPNTFTTSVGARLDVPLGQGRGKFATAGPEMAAAAAARAEERLFLHTAALETFFTVTAYWDLAAAQERLNLLSESAATQARILEVTRDLIAADELPASDLSRSQARRAGVLREIAEARRDLVATRLKLVEVMGQSTPDVERTPLAADALIDDRTLDPNLARWIALALRDRNDLAASAETVVAADILARSARANLKRRLDLGFNLSWQGFHESYGDGALGYSGYWEAASGHIAGPSYLIALRFGLPFKNDAAKGRYAQSQAQAQQSRINERNLERQIRLQLTDLVNAHLRKLEQAALQRTSLDNIQTSLQSSYDLFEAGELTLIDLLTTEEQRTRAWLALVATELEIRVLEARILFESGQLLDGREDPETLSVAGLGLSPLVRSKGP